jgi:hypothetical protein
MKDQLTPDYTVSLTTQDLIYFLVCMAGLIYGFWVHWGAVCAFVGS